MALEVILKRIEKKLKEKGYIVEWREDGQPIIKMC